MLDEFAKTYIAAGNLDAALKSAEESMPIFCAASLRKALTMASPATYPSGLSALATSSARKATGQGALAAYEESLRSASQARRQPKGQWAARNTASRRPSTGSAISSFNPPSTRKRSRPSRKALPSAAR